MDNSVDLKVLLASPASLVIVETNEEARFMALLRSIATDLKADVWQWSSASGLTNNSGAAMYQTQNPHQALNWITDVQAGAVFVFADAQPILNDSYVVRRIKETAAQLSPDQTIIMTTPTAEIPPELGSVAHLWKLRPPELDELTDLIRRTASDLAERNFEVAIDEASLPSLANALRGLSVGQAERLIQQAAFPDGALGANDVAALQNARAALFTADGILELIEADSGTLDSVGGLNGLKDWLRLRIRAQAAPQLNLPAPRGILLTGVPGCGKSFIAKTLARTWQQPLVLLDPSRLYSKYIGESEARLAKSLTAVDAMAPAVLWIDEIEKGFATSAADSDGGTSSRLLGTFLRWMQDRPEGVFIVATANNVAWLPPEFLRKGRFDEIFFVDLPDAAARSEILTYHLSFRDHDPAGFDLPRLAAATSGYSGAEIEGAVVGATYRAFAKDESLTTSTLLQELAAAVPLSVSRAESIGALRAWASERAVRA